MDVGIIGRTTLKPSCTFYVDFFIFVFLNLYSRPPKLPRFITSGIRAIRFFPILSMATMKFEIPLLDCSTRFSLGQVKMRVVIV